LSAPTDSIGWTLKSSIQMSNMELGDQVWCIS
jgi:hypothetical protein